MARILLAAALLKLSHGLGDDIAGMLQVSSAGTDSYGSSILASQPADAALKAGLGQALPAMTLTNKTASAISARMAYSLPSERNKAGFLKIVEEEATRTGLLQAAVRAAKDMGTTYNAAKGGAWDSFWVGMQMHAQLQISAGPVVNVLVYFPVCVRNTCKDEATQDPTDAKYGAFKICSAVVGGMEPWLTNWQAYGAPRHLEMLPVFALAGGNFEYSQGGRLEIGVAGMAYGGELGAIAELSLTDPKSGVHWWVLEVATSKANMGGLIAGHHDSDGEHAAPLVDVKAGVVAGWGWCSDTQGR